MKKLIPTPSVGVAIVAVVLALGGGAYAAPQIAKRIAKNTVGTAQIKNGSILGQDIRNGAVNSDDVAKGGIANSNLSNDAVQSHNVVNDSLNGDDVLESSLGEVPSAARALNATHATNAANLGGRAASGYVTTDTLVTFRAKLGFGETREIVTNGPIGLEAQCRENIAGEQDEVRLLAVSRVEGAFMQGDTPHSGPGASSTYLTPATPADSRTMGGVVSGGATPNEPMADDDIDTGFVAGPNGEYIGIDETTMFALRVGGASCMVVGLAVIL